MIVRAFDGLRCKVVGEINLPIQVGPTIFNIEFQVMDITPTYSCLLGRPWIHDAKVVPSTLHQKIKFVVGDKLVTIQAEDDMIINKPLTIPYVDTAEMAMETTFQALEIANVERVPRDMRTVTQMMVKIGYQPGQGLGKKLSRNCGATSNQGQSKEVRSAILLDVVAISALIIYGTRVVLGYKQTWDLYQVEMPIDKALDTLLRLGLATENFIYGRRGLLAIPCSEAYDVLRERWNSLLS
ncbi:hypothetical protein Fmac_028196 [Flemingia macrophylla]|uniref:G-patch domain-containing protein n=1 Tax=Flemingia macrophylla TaxID=520843 RepID=A0ABD1L6T4_9FABA